MNIPQLISDALDVTSGSSLGLPHRSLSPAAIVDKIVAHFNPDGRSFDNPGALVVVGGGPVSGKSTFISRMAHKVAQPERVALLLTGDLKKFIPEYEPLFNLYKPDNPDRHLALQAGFTEAQLDSIGHNIYAFFEQEKNLLLIAAAAKLLKDGYIVMLEHHLDDPKIAQDLITAAKNADAQSLLVVPDVSLATFFDRGREREKTAGKWFVVKPALSHHKKLEQHWPAYTQIFDIALRCDNDGTIDYIAPTAIAVKGRLSVIDEAAYTRARMKEDIVMNETVADADFTMRDLSFVSTGKDDLPFELAKDIKPALAASGCNPLLQTMALAASTAPVKNNRHGPRNHL